MDFLATISFNDESKARKLPDPASGSANNSPNYSSITLAPVRRDIPKRDSPLTFIELYIICIHKDAPVANPPVGRPGDYYLTRTIYHIACAGMVFFFTSCSSSPKASKVTDCAHNFYAARARHSAEIPRALIHYQREKFARSENNWTTASMGIHIHTQPWGTSCRVLITRLRFLLCSKYLHLEYCRRCANRKKNQFADFDIRRELWPHRLYNKVQCQWKECC